MSYLDSYFCNSDQTELFQVVIAFAFGLAAGPISSGIAFLIVYTIFFEVFLVFATGMREPYWYPEARIAIFCSGILGWVLGRWLVADETGIDELSGMPERVCATNVIEDY